MNDEERKAPEEEVKKQIDEMTDEELEQVAGSGLLDPIKKTGESVKNGL